MKKLIYWVAKSAYYRNVRGRTRGDIRKQMQGMDADARGTYVRSIRVFHEFESAFDLAEELLGGGDPPWEESDPKRPVKKTVRRKKGSRAPQVAMSKSTVGWVVAVNGKEHFYPKRDAVEATRYYEKLARRGTDASLFRIGTRNRRELVDEIS